MRRPALAPAGRNAARRLKSGKKIAQIVKMLEMADQTHCFVGFSLLKITLFVVEVCGFDVFFAKFAPNTPDFTDFQEKRASFGYFVRKIAD
ncbi:MAG: hypothetical protein J6P30_01290 [Fibrobacter sp.]|nr:hypothetical protein [Fibrobacter sp.]